MADEPNSLASLRKIRSKKNVVLVCASRTKRRAVCRNHVEKERTDMMSAAGRVIVSIATTTVTTP